MRGRSAWLRPTAGLRGALGGALRGVLVVPLAGALATAALPQAARSETAKAAETSETASTSLDEVEALIDEGRAAEALAALERLAKPAGDGDLDARALLLRSTARFMLGRNDDGLADLEQALELDPSLRQGWLNRAAFDLAEGRLDAALESLERARELDPAAPDNDLNIGAVLLMKGEFDGARTSFERYLAANPRSAAAAYLVATNYGLAGLTEPAVRHLRAAIELDETVRLRARTDPNFATLAADDAFRALLDRDGYTPPPGSHLASRAFDTPYEGAEGDLLGAVLDALQLSDRQLARPVEVTDGWALAWTDFRVKVANDAEGRGTVSLSAPAERFTESEWRTATAELFGRIALQLELRD